MDTIPTVMTMTGHLLMVKTVTAITLATDIQATRTATMAFLVTALMATTIMAEISRGRTKILTDQIMRIEIVSCGRISVMLMIMIMLMLGITTGTGFFLCQILYDASRNVCKRLRVSYNYKDPLLQLSLR